MPASIPHFLRPQESDADLLYSSHPKTSNQLPKDLQPADLLEPAFVPGRPDAIAFAIMLLCDMIVDASLVVDAVCDPGWRGVAARLALDEQPPGEPLTAPGHFAFEILSALRAAANRPTPSRPLLSRRPFRTPSRTRSISKGSPGPTFIELGSSRNSRSATPTPSTSPRPNGTKTRCSPATTGLSVPGQEHAVGSSPSHPPKRALPAPTLLPLATSKIWSHRSAAQTWAAPLRTLAMLGAHPASDAVRRLGGGSLVPLETRSANQPQESPSNSVAMKEPRAVWSATRLRLPRRAGFPRRRSYWPHECRVTGPSRGHRDDPMVRYHPSLPRPVAADGHVPDLRETRRRPFPDGKPCRNRTRPQLH